MVFFFLRRIHKYSSFCPFFFNYPTAHLKSSPSDDESESEIFVSCRFRGLVHDKSIFLRCPTLSKGRERSAPDDASVQEEDEEEDEEEEDEEEEEEEAEEEEEEEEEELEGSATLVGGFAILNDHATQTVPTPVALQRMLSRVPTPIAVRRVHWYWFRFRHTRVWVWALCWVEVL